MTDQVVSNAGPYYKMLVEHRAFPYTVAAATGTSVMFVMTDKGIQIVSNVNPATVPALTNVLANVAKLIADVNYVPMTVADVNTFSTMDQSAFGGSQGYPNTNNLTVLNSDGSSEIKDVFTPTFVLSETTSGSKIEAQPKSTQSASETKKVCSDTNEALPFSDLRKFKLSLVANIKLRTVDKKVAIDECRRLCSQFNLPKVINSLFKLANDRFAEEKMIHPEIDSCAAVDRVINSIIDDRVSLLRKKNVKR